MGRSERFSFSRSKALFFFLLQKKECQSYIIFHFSSCYILFVSCLLLRCHHPTSFYWKWPKVRKEVLEFLSLEASSEQILTQPSVRYGLGLVNPVTLQRIGLDKPRGIFCPYESMILCQYRWKASSNASKSKRLVGFLM